MRVKERHVGLDILRIVSMIMIVTLHYLGKGGFLWETEPYTPLYYLVYGIEALCLVSVNAYVLISSYFLVESNEVRKKKLLKLYATVWFYNFIISVLLYKLDVPFSKMEIIYSIFPFFTKRYWYVNAYILLYLLHPYLNKLVQSINKRELQRLLITLLAFFCVAQSVFPVLEWTYDETQGYGIIWFVVLYLVAVYIKQYGGVLNKARWYQLLLVWCGASGACVCSKIILSVVLDSAGRGSVYTDIWYTYNSLPVLLGSICIFIFFTKIELKSEKVKVVVTKVGGATLGV